MGNSSKPLRNHDSARGVELHRGQLEFSTKPVDNSKGVEFHRPWSGENSLYSRWNVCQKICMTTSETFTPLTRHQRQLIDAADTFAHAPHPDPSDLCFIGREFVQVNLPHQDQGEKSLWVRKNGDLTMAVQAGVDGETGGLLGLPFGTIPRLLLYWITTEAVRTESRTLHIGDSLNDFVRKVGLNPATGGGKRGDSARLKEQCRRLFRARFTYTRTISQPGRVGESYVDLQIAPRGELLWTPPEHGSQPLFGSRIELGDLFFESIMESQIPIDLRAVKILKKSPLALDLYSFLSYRAFLSWKNQREVIIPWRSLHQQVGSNYSCVKNFRKYAKDAITKIQIVYPALQIEYLPGRLKLEISEPVVSIKSPHCTFQLLTL